MLRLSRKSDDAELTIRCVSECCCGKKVQIEACAFVPSLIRIRLTERVEVVGVIYHGRKPHALEGGLQVSRSI